MILENKLNITNQIDLAKAIVVMSKEATISNMKIVQKKSERELHE